jgi:hypothetical protein
VIKEEVKALCEADPQLQWWAMVFFAEVCDLVHHLKDDDSLLATMIRQKAAEFPAQVVYEQVRKAKGGV